MAWLKTCTSTNPSDLHTHGVRQAGTYLCELRSEISLAVFVSLLLPFRPFSSRFPPHHSFLECVG